MNRLKVFRKTLLWLFRYSSHLLLQTITEECNKLVVYRGLLFSGVFLVQKSIVQSLLLFFFLVAGKPVTCYQPCKILPHPPVCLPYLSHLFILLYLFSVLILLLLKQSPASQTGNVGLNSWCRLSQEEIIKTVGSCANKSGKWMTGQ